MPVAQSLRIIDFHSHHIHPSWTLTTTAGLASAERERWDTINRTLVDAEALVDAVATGDLAGRVVNMPTALMADADGKVPSGTERKMNDQIAELIARHPARLFGLATIDAFSGDAGATELNRAVKELGLRGVFVDSARGEWLLDAPQARPTLAAAAALGVPVFAHPVNPRQLTRQLSPFGRLGTFLARGTINAAAMIALLEGGVFDELPDLRVIVTTLAIGGVLLAGVFGTKSNIRDDAPELARRHIYVDTMGFDPILIRACIDLLGSDHVLVGSDWPIVSTGPITARVESAFSAIGLSDDDRDLIAGGNALRLLGVGGGPGR